MLTFAKKHDMEKFTVCVYGLQELATCYFPGSTPQSASHRLRSWMRTDRLSEALEEAGYVPGQRLLTPKQVAVIVDHIGEP